MYFESSCQESVADFGWLKTCSFVPCRLDDAKETCSPRKKEEEKGEWGGMLCDVYPRWNQVSARGIRTVFGENTIGNGCRNLGKIFG